MNFFTYKEDSVGYVGTRNFVVMVYFTSLEVPLLLELLQKMPEEAKNFKFYETT